MWKANGRLESKKHRGLLDLLWESREHDMSADVAVVLLFSYLLSVDFLLIDVHHSYAGIPLTEESQQKRYGDNPKFQVKSSKLQMT